MPMMNAEKKPLALSASKQQPKPVALDSQHEQKNDGSLAIQWKTAKPAKATVKTEKLQVVKSKGKEDAYTVRIDEQNSFRVRVSDAGFMVVLTWRERPGKWPERYLCYLSKSEWQKAQRNNLEAFIAQMKMKLSERLAVESSDSDKIADLTARLHRIENPKIPKG